MLLALLARLHAGRNHRPIAQTITMLLEAVRAHAGIALWPTGEQALANCAEAGRHGPALRARRLLLPRLRRTNGGRCRTRRGGRGADRRGRHRGRSDDDRPQGKGAGVSRSSSLPIRRARRHGTCPAGTSTRSRRLWFEPLCGCSPVELLEAAEEELRRDRAEAVRVAYVADTRARDLLVVPVCRRRAHRRLARRAPPSPLSARRVQAQVPILRPGVRPSVTTACSTAARKAFPSRGLGSTWSPRVARRTGQRSHGGIRLSFDSMSRSRRLYASSISCEADPEGAAAAAGEQMYARWKSDRGETLARASHPSISVQTVTSLAGAETADQRIQVELVAGIEPERPSGRRFGALVHSLLAAIDLDADPDAIRAAATVYGRLVDATDEEIDAAGTAVAAALVHPIMRLAAAGARHGRLRRETPVLLQREDNTLVEGVVDLAFRQETSDFNGWAVVDFKTSREFEANQAKYTAQVALYVEAIHTGDAPASKGNFACCLIEYVELGQRQS